MKRNWFDFHNLLSDHSNVAEIVRQATAEDPASVRSWGGEGDISVGKGGRAYNAHSYPTKVPPEAIEPFIAHYTEPGELVLDPFCGSGMTGLAAQRAGRGAILNDLSSLALHLAYNHTEACDPQKLQEAWHQIQESLSGEIDHLYGITCDNCYSQAQIRYTIWSDVYSCPSCKGEVPLWKVGVDRAAGKVSRRLMCSSCEEEFSRSANHRIRVEPAWLTYLCTCSPSLHERDMTQEERERLTSWPTDSFEAFHPTRAVEEDREMYKRSALHLQGIESVSDFYTSRNLQALALLWDSIGAVEDERVRDGLAFAFTNTAWHGTKMRRYNARGGHRPLTGTLYIPQLSSEANIFSVFENKIAHLVRFYEEMDQAPNKPPVVINQGTATDLGWLENDSIDYVFTDPPFGSNIFYADCNLIAEAWLGQVTDDSLEAVVNRSRGPGDGGKTLHDYEALMESAFHEMYRVLKPGRWATVVFQSSDGDVWSAIERSAAAAGFDVGSAGILDKGQESMKGYKGRSGAENVASFDIILHLQKSGVKPTQNRERLDNDALREFAVAVVGRHLERVSPEHQENCTLPYLYSLVVRELLNGGYSLSGLTMEGLRTYLKQEFSYRDGFWSAVSVSGPAV